MSLPADDKPPDTSGKEEDINAQHHSGGQVGEEQQAHIEADKEELGGENHRERFTHGETGRHAEMVDMRLVGMEDALAVG